MSISFFQKNHSFNFSCRHINKLSASKYSIPLFHLATIILLLTILLNAKAHVCFSGVDDKLDDKKWAEKWSTIQKSFSDYNSQKNFQPFISPVIMLPCSALVAEYRDFPFISLCLSIYNILPVRLFIRVIVETR